MVVYSKKVIFLFIALAAILSLIISCGAKTEKDSVVDDTAPLSFSWYIAYDFFTPPNAWGEDPVSGWIKQNKHVDITWMNPSGAAGDKLNLMIATGDLPDVICLDRGARVSKLIDNGLLLPLDPYLDEMPNLKKWAGINLDLLRYKDGKLYQFPNWYINPDATHGNGNAGWAVNTKIYKALGSPPLETFDDLEAYLQKVKAAYPDIIPFEPGDGFQAGSLVYRGMDEHLYNNIDNYLGTPKNGKFTKLFDDPYVKDTFLFLSRLYRNKLMSQDVLTETRDQVLEKLINGRVAVVTSWDFANQIPNANRNNKIDPHLYDVIWPPVRKGVDKTKVTLSGYATEGWNVNVFSKNSESKIRRILHYLDWATGEEGQRILCYGPQGYFWNELDENGVPIWNEQYQKATDKQRYDSRIFNWDWVGNTTWVDIGKVAANKRIPPDRQDSIIRMQGDVLWKTVENENEYAYEKPDPASDLGIIATQIADLYEDTRAKAVLSASDENALAVMKDAQQELDTIGYDKFLAYHNTKWAEQKALLQKLKGGEVSRPNL